MAFFLFFFLGITAAATENAGHEHVAQNCGVENARHGKCEKCKIRKAESTETCFGLFRTAVRADLKVCISPTQDQFPRNFIITNVTLKSLKCYEDVVRVARVTRMIRGNCFR